MDTVLKSFPLSLLLRSLFSGVFFVLSFHELSPHLIEFDAKNIFKVEIPFALVAGCVVYGLHRSIIYPWIEWGMNLKSVKRFRKQWLPLISQNSIKNLETLWDASATSVTEKPCKRGERMSVWADYAHLQYSSALSIICGTYASAIISRGMAPAFHGDLFALTMIFCVAGFVSDWRLHSVMESFTEASCNNSN